MIQKKKKILFLHFDMKGGGAEKVLVNLVNNLDKEKYDITVQTIFGVGTHIKDLAPHIHYKSFFKKQFAGFTTFQKLFSPSLLHKFFIKEKYDLEIAYLETSPTRIVSGCKNPDTKKIAWLHITLDSFPWFRNHTEMEKAYNKFDKIVSVSQNVQNAFIQTTGLSNLPFSIQRNVVDSDSIKSQAREDVSIDIDLNKINLCYIGRLVPHKDPMRLLKAINNIKKRGFSNWHLYFLGTGELESDIRTYIEHNSLVQDVTMLGYQQNPYKYIARMSLYVCPSHAEGYSTAATEALILGVPVFTTNCGGMEEILEGGKFGKIVPDKDKDFENDLEQILRDKELYNHYKDMAQKRSPFFSKETIIKENECLISSILKN